MQCYRFFVLTILILGCGVLSALPQDPWAEAERIVAAIRIPEFPDREFSIIDFGAQPGGEIDCLPALREAIFQCNQVGGGRVLIPPGRWLIKGPIHLKSNINLHMEDGAHLLFSKDTHDFLPVVLTRWEGTDCYNYSPYIYAFQATNIAITGKGILDGQAKEGFATWKPRQKPDQLLLRQMGNDGFPVQRRIFGKGHFLRPPMIQFYGCSNILLEDFKLVDSPFWCIHPVFSNHVTIRGVEVYSYNLNNDGVDPDSSTNVLIEDCLFNTGDDAVAIKAGRDQDGWRAGQPSENIIVRNCEMPKVHNGLAIGSEMSGGVRNVFFENCRIGEARYCLFFKANLDRGGFVEHVRVRDIEVGKSTVAFISFTTDYHSWRRNHYPPTFRDYLIENVTCGVAEQYGIYAVGKAGAPISQIRMKNVNIDQARIPQLISVVDDFVFENVSINGKPAQPEPVPPEMVGELKQF